MSLKIVGSNDRGCSHSDLGHGAVSKYIAINRLAACNGSAVGDDSTDGRLSLLALPNESREE